MAGAVQHVEELVERSAWTEAVEAIGDVQVPASSAPELALRVLFAESWARMYLGELELAEAVIERARSLAEGPAFDERDRADAMYRLGCVRLKLGKVSNAVALFTEALRLGSDARLCARAYEWRSRCFQLQREWEAAQADAERALELGEASGDRQTSAHALFQLSLIAERGSNPLLARFYAEQAKEIYERVGDRQSLARILNNLGGLAFLLGDAPGAVAYLGNARALALELGNEADAAQALSSLAQVHLRSGAPQLAEEQALDAIALLDGRDDYLDELGSAHLVLGRALLEQARREEALRAFAAAECAYERVGSASHVAEAWIAQGDHALATGNPDLAAGLFRRAAHALQDVHF
jgi:tetratricopeptide (TPR) repeat protein